jgi:hypothetical protein
MQMIFFQKMHLFFNSAKLAYLKSGEAITILENINCRKNSSQKQTQFSQVNNLLDAIFLKQVVFF